MGRTDVALPLSGAHGPPPASAQAGADSILRAFRTGWRLAFLRRNSRITEERPAIHAKNRRISGHRPIGSSRWLRDCDAQRRGRRHGCRRAGGAELLDADLGHLLGQSSLHRRVAGAFEHDHHVVGALLASSSRHPLETDASGGWWSGAACRCPAPSLRMALVQDLSVVSHRWTRVTGVKQARRPIAEEHGGSHGSGRGRAGRCRVLRRAVAPRGGPPRRRGGWRTSAPPRADRRISSRS